MKNNILLICIGLFVIILSLIASHTPINWYYFLGASLVMAILIVLQKGEIRKQLSGEGRDKLSLFRFNELLKLSLIQITELSKIELNEKFSPTLTTIVDEIFPNIDNFRISIINQIGVAKYTNIVIPFAKAERIINRSISALIDGYMEESKKNIFMSISFLKLTIDEINIVEKNG